jgi:hypothetical protein
MARLATDEASLKEGTDHFGLVPNTLPGFGLSTDHQHVPDVSSAAHSYPNQTGGGLRRHQLGARAYEHEASCEAS